MAEGIRDKQKHDTDVALEARGLIRGERAVHYGPPHRNFKVIAELWSAYLRPRLDDMLRESGGRYTGTGPGIELVDANDVANLMTLLKVAREASGNGYHRDSTVDVIGYQAIKELIADYTPEEFMAEMRRQ